MHHDMTCRISGRQNKKQRTNNKLLVGPRSSQFSSSGILGYIVAPDRLPDGHTGEHSPVARLRCQESARDLRARCDPLQKKR